MKNLLILFFATLVIASCNNTETNSPAFQASIEDEFFKANFTEANYIESGEYFVLQGKNNNQIITLRGSYPPDGVNIEFGEGSENFAIYEDINGIVYSTAVSGGDGSMRINENSTEDKNISGEFNFTAISISQDTLSISGGVFYKVSYLNEEGDGSNSGSFSAELNGSAFVPLDVFANDNGSAIVVKGVINSETILLGFPDDVEAGTYELPMGGFTARVDNGSDNEDAISGEVVIIAHDITEKTISGTFQFQTPTNTVNTGQFNVTYQ